MSVVMCVALVSRPGMVLYILQHIRTVLRTNGNRID